MPIARLRKSVDGRLAAMSVVASATTNASGRVQAQAIVDTLSLVPTNELNDVSWLTDE